MNLSSIFKANDATIQVASQFQQKKPKIGLDYFATIANKLFEIQQEVRKNYKDGEIETIEIEVYSLR